MVRADGVEDRVEMVSESLVRTILEQYTMPWNGIHGVSHWGRVLENGRRLAALTGARLHVVELFAVLHDSRRHNDGIDFEHGPASAVYARSLNGAWFDLVETDLDLLVIAIRDHTNGLTAADVTLQTCWDADRLDLGRVGILPDPRRLCTAAAKDPAILAWANVRSEARVVPLLVREEWGIDLR